MPDLRPAVEQMIRRSLHVKAGEEVLVRATDRTEWGVRGATMRGVTRDLPGGECFVAPIGGEGTAHGELTVASLQVGGQQVLDHGRWVLES